LRSGVKRVSILGSTGSIGESALSVARHLKKSLRICGLAAGGNVKSLARQAAEFRPEWVALADSAKAGWLKGQLGRLRGKRPRLLAGPRALEELASRPGADMVLSSVVGAAGLLPTLAANRSGKDIALANKETLVAAGQLVSELCRRHQVALLPVDSEHNAIFQCLAGIGDRRELRRLILTASGGPFRRSTMVQLRKVSRAQALKHPTWAMGPKITVDSSTLMNKGLEVIEAHWLFRLPYDQISVVVHPQSVIHSMVETVDGSVLAQMGPTDMRLPIQFAFTYPRRMPPPLRPLDFFSLHALTFEAPDLERFPCLGLAYRAGRLAGSAPAALNAANEVAVGAFLKGKLDFLGIPAVLKKVLDHFVKLPATRRAADTLDQILSADRWARQEAESLLYA